METFPGFPHDVLSDISLADGELAKFMILGSNAAATGITSPIDNLAIFAVPEPSNAVMFIGFLCFGGLIRRRRA